MCKIRTHNQLGIGQLYNIPLTIGWRKKKKVEKYQAWCQPVQNIIREPLTLCYLYNYM